MGAAVKIIRAGDLVPPAGLDAYGKFAWKAAVEAIGPLRGLTSADLLSLEAACRSWARWKALEERIAAGAESGDELAGEIIRVNGKDTVTTLRAAADAAFGQWQRIAREFGIAFPSLRDKVPELDLFGLPERPGRGQKGRPAFVPSIQDRNRVKLLLALGWSNPRIAAALEITPPTLHKYFKRELEERDVMRDRLDARRFEVAANLMNSGNVAGLKLLNQMIETSDRAGIARRFTDGDDADEGDDDETGRSGRGGGSRRRGKKEVQEEEARHVGGDESGWGDLLDPSAVKQ